MNRMPKQKCITTYLDNDLDAEIEKMAKKDRSFKWVIINDAVRDFVKRRKARPVKE